MGFLGLEDINRLFQDRRGCFVAQLNDFTRQFARLSDESRASRRSIWPGMAKRPGRSRTSTPGESDIPLTERGEANARSLGERLRGVSFDRVLTSPLQRARRTCELAGFARQVAVEPDLTEWDYGEYDGLTTAEIRRKNPDWSLFRDGCQGGESVEQVGARADRVIARLRATVGPQLALRPRSFFPRAGCPLAGPAARPTDGCFYLSTASLSILGYEHSRDEPAIRLWNDDRHVRA